MLPQAGEQSDSPLQSADQAFVRHISPYSRALMQRSSPERRASPTPILLRDRSPGGGTHILRRMGIEIGTGLGNDFPRGTRERLKACTEQMTSQVVHDLTNSNSCVLLLFLFQLLSLYLTLSHCLYLTLSRSLYLTLSLTLSHTLSLTLCISLSLTLCISLSLILCF
jgi:hypothetical protein